MIPSDAFAFWLRFVVFLIPLRKLSQSFADADSRAEAVIGSEGGAVRVGNRHVAGLHADQLAMGGKVVVLGQNTGTDKLLLQRGDVIEEVFRRTAADVVDCVGRQGKPVLAGRLFGRALHDADHALHDIVHIGEIALAVAVVEDLDGLSGNELLRSGEIEHIRATCGAVDGKEAQSRRGDVVELRVAMRQQLVRFLRRGVERHRIVHLVVGRERHLLVAAVNRGGRSVYEMLHGIVPARFQNVVEADQVRFDIDVRVVDRIADARLCREVHDDRGLVFRKDAVDQRLVRNRAPDKDVPYRRRLRRLFDQPEPVFLQGRIVIVVHVVERDDRAAGEFTEQPQHQIRADEAGRTGHKDRFVVEINVYLSHG